MYSRELAESSPYFEALKKNDVEVGAGAIQPPV
jgi:hypothetical protein